MSVQSVKGAVKDTVLAGEQVRRYIAASFAAMVASRTDKGD